MASASYAALSLALPSSVQSNGWQPHAAVALLDLGAGFSPVTLNLLTEHMTNLAGQDVSRVSAMRGAWVMDKQGFLEVSKKGTYLLNNKGVAYARSVLGTVVAVGAATTVAVEVAPVVEVAPAPPVVVEAAPVAPVVVAPAPVIAPVAPVSAGVSWLPPEAGTGSVHALYEGDEYLLSLAVEQTPCFGSYSPRADTCDACPIAGACMSFLVTRMAQVSATLAKRDEEALKAAEARRVEEARLAVLRKEEERKAAERKAVESILGTPAPVVTPVVNTTSAGKTPTFDTFTPVSAPVAPAPVPAPAAQVKYTEITAAFPGVCSGCKGKVTKGDTVHYVSGKGMYHPTCLA